MGYKRKNSPLDENQLRLIMGSVCYSFGVDSQSFLSQIRKRDFVFARHAFCFLARTHTNHTLPSIGGFLGNRNHATIINSIKQCSDLLEFHPEFKRKYQKSEFLFETTRNAEENFPL